MPGNESSLRVDFMRIFNSKFVYQQYVFFTNIGNDYTLKIKKITVNYASTTNQINIYIYFFNFERVVIPIEIKSLLYLSPFQAKVNFYNP